jgi:hypothetical protein
VKTDATPDIVIRKRVTDLIFQPLSTSVILPVKVSIGST